MKKNQFVLLSFLLLLCLQLPSLSAKGQNKIDPDTYVNVDKKGVILEGYDPVGFFTAGKPIKGLSKYTSKYKGAIYQFASAENKALFDANPEKYKVAFGGWCAYAVSKGYVASIDVETWSIVEGRLIVQYSEGAKKSWDKDVDGNLKKALKNWPEIAEKKKNK